MCVRGVGWWWWWGGGGGGVRNRVTTNKRKTDKGRSYLIPQKLAHLPVITNY